MKLLLYEKNRIPVHGRLCSYFMPSPLLKLATNWLTCIPYTY